jgi:hypothetical protein
MLQAFIGIVSRQGLELICPEHPQTARFLRRRVQREAGKLACFWSVIPEEVVKPIQAALRRGQSAEALEFLQQQAREYGFFFPLDDDEADLPVIRDHA